MGSLGEAVFDLSAQYSQFKSDVAAAEGIAKKGSDSIASELGKITTNFANTSKNILGKLAKTIGVGVGLAAGAITAFGVKSLQAFGEFQDGMGEVFTLLPGISQQAMDEMSDQVKNLSVDIGRLPEEIIPALYQALSAGVPQENVFDFLETAHQAALGGVTDLTTAVDGISSVVNAYGAETISATEASDLMFTAVRLGKTTFEEMAQSLSNVTPISAALGVSFGDVTAAIASMTAQGTPTAQATVQIRSLLQELGTSGTEAFDIFAEAAGQTFPDFMASGFSLSAAMDVLRIASENTSIPIQDMFGNVRAGIGALQLSGDSFETFLDNTMAMHDATGATGAAYETMNANMNRSFEVIKSFGQTVLLDFGEVLANIIGPSVQGLAEKLANARPQIEKFFELFEAGAKAFINFIKELLGGNKDLEGLLDTLPEPIRGIAEVVGNIILFLQEKIPIIRDFIVENWDAIKGALAGLGIALLAGGLIAAITAVVGFLTSGFGIIMILVGLFSAAWASDWNGIRTTITEWWEQTGKPIFETLVEWLKVNIPAAIETVKNFWNNTLMPALKTAWEWIQTNLVPIFQTIWDWLATNIPEAIETLKTFWEETLKPTLVALWEYINENVVPILEKIGEVITLTVIAAIEAWKKVYDEKLKPVLEDIKEWIADKIQPVLETLAEWFNGEGMTAIKDFASDALDKLTNGLAGISGWLDGLITKLQNFITMLRGIDNSGADPYIAESPAPMAVGLKQISGLLPGVTRGIADMTMAFQPMQVDHMVSGVSQGIGGSSPTAAGIVINLNYTAGASPDADAEFLAEEIARLVRTRI